MKAHATITKRIVISINKDAHIEFDSSMPATGAVRILGRFNLDDGYSAPAFRVGQIDEVIKGLKLMKEKIKEGKK